MRAAACAALALALAATLPAALPEDAAAAAQGSAQGGTAPPGFDPSLCQHLPRHRPAPDVEYTPGVDVRGNRVAPADLPGSAGAMAPLERFELPLTAGFARRLGFAVPGGLPALTEFGRLTIQGNRLLFNGQPLGGASEAELYALCRTR